MTDLEQALTAEQARKLEQDIFDQSYANRDIAMNTELPSADKMLIDFKAVRKENLIKYQTQKTFDYMDSMIRAYILLPDQIRTNKEVILEAEAKLEEATTADEEMVIKNGIAATIDQILRDQLDIENRMDKARQHNLMLLFIEQVIERAEK